MKTARLLFLISILITASLSPAVANAADNWGRKEVWIRLNSYSPCQVTLEFAYTQNITVVDVSSMGPSQYEVTHSPTTLSFEAQDLDEFIFGVELEYPYLMRQSIKITHQSGADTAPDMWEIPVEGEQIIFHIEVTTSRQPHYPTVTEIAENVIVQMVSKLDSYTYEIRRQTVEITDGLNMISMAMGIIGILSVVTAWVVYRDSTRRRSD